MRPSPMAEISIGVRPSLRFSIGFLSGTNHRHEPGTDHHYFPFAGPGKRGLSLFFKTKGTMPETSARTAAEETTIVIGSGVAFANVLYICTKTAPRNIWKNTPRPAAVPDRLGITRSAPTCAFGSARPWPRVVKKPGTNSVSGVTW